MSQPNILIFFTDQQRWDTVGAYRSPLDLTPNLDAAARRGTVCEQAFTCQPVCGPARACLQTGKYATETGNWRNGIMLPMDERTIAHRLGEAGYDLGYIGKWHLSTDRFDPVPPERRGGWDGLWEAADILEIFSHPYDFVIYDADNQRRHYPGYRVDAETDRVLHFLNQPREQPFCLMVSYLEPHHQNDWNQFVAPDGYAERYANAWVPEDLRAHRGDWMEQIAGYYGMIRSLDENYGRVMAELDRQGLRENTVVIFVSDHGCHFRTRNGEYKRSCHEASIHIPLVVTGPGFDHGRRAPELVSLLDVPATVCDVAGLGVPEAMRGRSLRALAERPPAEWRDDVYIQISESCTARALRTERWKYCVTAPPGPQTGTSDEYTETHLYDLWADPHELVNLVGRASHRAIADELRSRLLRHIAEAGEGEPEVRAGRFA